MKVSKKPDSSKLDTVIEILSSDRPILLAFFVFLGATILVVSLTGWFYAYNAAFLENILVEAHGMLFDLLIIGVFVLWLNSKGERRQRITRYREEITDYLGWKSDTAMHRIRGNIIRLNREDVGDIYLRDANLREADLQGANLEGADLIDANLLKADLSGVNLNGAKYNNNTIWPDDFDPKATRAINIDEKTG